MEAHPTIQFQLHNKKQQKQKCLISFTINFIDHQTFIEHGYIFPAWGTLGYPHC